VCGIAGCVDLEHGLEAPNELVAAMTDVLRHRGPDDAGMVADGPVTLGHRRLSIIDLSPAGHGPMPSPDGSLWLTFNGEIYNYIELREELRALGREFHTESDTEVLLVAYAQWGTAMLDRLNGMFAFAIWDSRASTVLLARDRFGVKPLYYTTAAGRFRFASEIKGLLVDPAVPRAANDARILEFLAYGLADHTAETMFDGVLQLPPGSYLEVRPYEPVPTPVRWYTLRPAEQSSKPLGARTRELLDSAITLRLRSDVPVGVSLSGGMDSSSVLGVASSLRSAEGIEAPQSFSARSSDPATDEHVYAAQVVAATGSRNAEVLPSFDGLVEELDSIVWHMDEPFHSPSVYGQRKVDELARNAGVIVLLDGQGGDEVLGGYRYHLGPFLAETARTRGWRAARREIALLHENAQVGRSLLAGLLAYHALPVPDGIRRGAVTRYASHRRLDPAALDPDFRRRAGPPTSRRHRPQSTLLAERREGLLRTSLPALLRYEDRNSMAFSVEARTPFLDFRLVERALALPASDLVRGGWTKAILRDGMAGVLPDTVRLRRDKLGFATPEARWLREIAPRVREWLGPGARTAQMIRPDVLARWCAESDEALAGRAGLWRVLSVELWLRQIEDRRRAA
jgi:asparagine synthase (glutamine-hydrolysing)